MLRFAVRLCRQLLTTTVIHEEKLSEVHINTS